MALSASTVWEVRTAGNDTNGGGFVTGAAGTDFSQQNAKNTVGSNISTTDAVNNGSNTTVTSATAAFTSAIVGNIIFFSGGTGTVTACWRQVTGFTNSTTITVDATIGNSTGMTMNIGGALLSPALPGNANASANVGATIWVKAGTYSITTASTNQIGGCFSKLSGGWLLRGYNATRGDLGTAPLIQASGISNFTLWTNASAGAIENITFDGANLTGSRCADLVSCLCYKVGFLNCKNSGVIASSGGCSFIYCYSSGCNTAGSAFNVSNSNRLYGCVSTGNTVTGFSCGNNTSLHFCISYLNTGATTDGFDCANVNIFFGNCISYGNGRDGFRIGNAGINIVNCIAESNTGTGFNVNNNSPRVQLLYCAGFSSGTNYTAGSGSYSVSYSFVTGTGSFFTNAASGDFSLNNTAGRGAALRAAGMLGVFPGGLTTGYQDIGAVQHQDGGGGGGGASTYVF